MQKNTWCVLARRDGPERGVIGLEAETHVLRQQRETYSGGKIWPAYGGLLTSYLSPWLNRATKREEDHHGHILLLPHSFCLCLGGKYRGRVGL